MICIMKKNCVLAFSVLFFACSFAVQAFEIERIFHPQRVTRGNTNVLKIQPIDDAAWLWVKGDSGLAEKGDETPHSGNVNSSEVKFAKFKAEFQVAENDGELVFDVSADERFYLSLDGRFVARGPNRAAVENWQYQTYRIRNLAPGKHVLEAVVSKIGDHAPLAQLSYRG